MLRVSCYAQTAVPPCPVFVLETTAGTHGGHLPQLRRQPWLQTQHAKHAQVQQYLQQAKLKGFLNNDTTWYVHARQGGHGGLHAGRPCVLLRCHLRPQLAPGAHPQGGAQHVC